VHVRQRRRDRPDEPRHRLLRRQHVLGLQAHQRNGRGSLVGRLASRRHAMHGR
jgi:hypothetical protein